MGAVSPEPALDGYGTAVRSRFLGLRGSGSVTGSSRCLQALCDTLNRGAIIVLFEEVLVLLAQMRTSIDFWIMHFVHPGPAYIRLEHPDPAVRDTETQGRHGRVTLH